MSVRSKMPNFDHCKDCPSQEKGIFCELEGLALDGLSQKKVTNTFKKGQTLFVQGNPPFGVYCISRGNVKVSKMGQNGKEAIVKIATEGDILGHRSVFTEQNHLATATAIEDTSVCFIDKKYIKKIVEQEPGLAFKLISRLGSDLGMSEAKVASFSQKNTLERTCELLLLLNNSHGVKEDNNHSRLNIILTREEMAAMVGTATETLIRIFSDLKKENIISQKGKSIFIIDEDKLIEFANLGF